VPGLVADAGDPGHLAVAGLGHPYCEGVLAITDNDEANLAAAQAAALLRPDLPVVTRTVSPEMEARMKVFGSPTVINPFDRFGDHLRLALRAPASYQLLTWLESGPGEPLPKRGDPPSGGHWIVCGYGRFGKEVTHDLRAEGYDVTIVEPGEAAENDPDAIVGRGYEPHVLTAVNVECAAGFVAGTDNDTTNLSLVAAAHRANPRMFIAARQNKPASASLFEAVDLDALLVPAEVVAHEVYAQLSTPLLWRFLREMPAKGDEWADSVVGKLTNLCGKHLQSLWKVRLTAVEAPALRGVFDHERVRLGDLLRSPDDRDQRLHTVVLLVARGDDVHLAPSDDFAVTLDDELLLVGEPAARRLLDSTLLIDATREYVLHNRHVPSSWIWRKLTRRTA
jgi:voltage-gated potassium channel